MGHRYVRALHIRAAERARVVEAITARLAKDGFHATRAKGPPALGDVRMLVRSASGSVFVELSSPAISSAARADAWVSEEWAAHLSKVLAEPVLALSVPEDGWGTKLVRFGRGEELASFSIDEGAAASRKRRFPVPAAVIGAGKRAGNVVLEPDCETIAEVLGRALGVPRTWLNPYCAGDADDGDDVLVFRQKREVPLVPEGRRRLTGFEPELTAYQGRRHAVGALAFDARANLETVAEHLSAFLQAFCPAGGLGVRAARGDRREVLAARFTRTSTVSARQLARGGTLELSEHSFDPLMGRCISPLFWIASRGEAEGDEDDEVPSLRFGLALDRPGADAPERAISDALRTLFEACVELEGCISAVLTAQGPANSLGAPALAYETVAGTEKAGMRTGWLRTHVRSPGWLVLVPRDAARRVAKNVPAEVSVERVRGGLLARFDAPTPFAMKSLEPMERWLAPLLGAA